MRRYYFDLVDGLDVSPDEEGMELPDVQSAQEEAALALAGLVKEMRLNRPQVGLPEIAIDVRDNAGFVMRVSFEFANRTVLDAACDIDSLLHRSMSTEIWEIVLSQSQQVMQRRSSLYRLEIHSSRRQLSAC
jgi:hypothetical protein